MSYGIEVARADGTKILTQNMPGGRVFVGILSVSVGSPTTTFTYDKIPGGANLRVLQVQSGPHIWSIGTNAQGFATVTFTPLTIRASYNFPTVLYVFTIATNELDYGIALVNDLGQRTTSCIYPTPEFLGKITFSTTPSSFSSTGENNFSLYIHATPTNLGAGRTRIVLWNLPSTTSECWFRGTDLIPASTTGTYTVEASYIRDPATAYTMPEAFIFALDGLVPSADSYGLRIYDNSVTPKLTFDAGLNHMVIRGYETTLSYPTTTSTAANSYTTLTNIFGTPIISVPNYFKETWIQRNPPTGLASDGKGYKGVIRRVGTSLFTKTIRTATYFEDSILNSTYESGVRDNLLLVVADGTLYGATP